ncbi:MAG: phosphate/phosphite/phosphonate ABC transporter substrate-binding protein [Deltaproteobacteria bacterium]|nr:MAG: phosphate/phosphite/phosphonate ABC transporter substrate-binding protein [Deltaproteobacteria bacterium]
MRIPVEKRLPCVYVAFLIVTLLLIAGAKTEAQVSIKALTLGAVYQSAQERVAEHFHPLVEYAARKLAPTGEIKSTVIVADNIPQLIELVERAQVDFYLESPFPTYLINRSGTGKILLRRWKGGMSEYRGVIFTSKASRITRLEDLRGKKMLRHPLLCALVDHLRRDSGLRKNPISRPRFRGAKSATFLPVRKKMS